MRAVRRAIWTSVDPESFSFLPNFLMMAEVFSLFKAIVLFSLFFDLASPMSNPEKEVLTRTGCERDFSKEEKEMKALFLARVCA